MTALVVTPLLRMPEVEAGDDLALLIVKALQDNGIELLEDDVLVVSSKVTSKALDLTASDDREAVVASQTEWVVAERRGAGGRTTRVVKSLAGPVMAAAGVDASNTGGKDHLLLLPEDPDAVCRDLHTALAAATGVPRFGLVLSDTAGRAWRAGQTDFALGAHGVAVTDDLRGGVDADGRPLEVTTRAVADELAAAADLVKGKAAAVPVAHLRGLPAGTVVGVGGSAGREPGEAASGRPNEGASSLVRTGPGDWFGLGRAESVRAALGVDPGSALSDRLGIASSGPEGVGERLARAVGVTLHDLPEVGVDVGPVRSAPGLSALSGSSLVAGQRRPATHVVVVSGPDPVDVGVAVGRLVVALWGEWLEGRVTSRAAGAVTVEVADLA